MALLVFAQLVVVPLLAQAAPNPRARPAAPASSSTPSSTPAPGTSATEGEVAQRRREEQVDRERRLREEREAVEAAERERTEAELQARSLRLQRERAGLVSPSAGLSLQGVGQGLRGQVNEDGSPARFGGMEYAGMATALVGYNDNVVQTRDTVDDRLIRRRASPFIGFDTMGILQHIGQRDEHDLRFQVRGQHYVPLSNDYDFTDDGTVNGAYTFRRELDPRSTLFAGLTSTLSTLNSARQGDAVVFRVDPYSVQRTFTLTTGRLALEHELSPSLRIVNGVDAAVSTVLHDAPILLPDGTRLIPRGIDYVATGGDSTLFKDFDYENIGFVRLRYHYLWSRLLLDLSTVPPRNNGPLATHLGELQMGFTHLFSSEVSSATTVGLQVATPLAGDFDQRPITSPSVYQTLAYVTPTTFASLAGGYTYGSVNPRLGFGTSVDGQFLFTTTPWQRTAVLRRLSFLAQGQASQAVLRASIDRENTLNVFAVSAEVRYGLSDGVSLMGGYNFRYANVTGLDEVPPLFRHIYFVGIMFYASTARVVPPLTTFAPPLQGG